MISVHERSAKAAYESVMAVHVADRDGIVLRGKDRMSWLNGLVTCDLAKLAAGEGTYGLIVEKKGRIQTDFFAVPARPADDALALIVPRDLRGALLATLDHYLIMEDVELEAIDLTIWQLHGPKARAVSEQLAAPFAGTLDRIVLGGAIVAAPRADERTFADRLAAIVRNADGILGDDAASEALRIERGVPRFGIEVDTTLYPHEASLEKLAVSFDKGCYLGQEVVYMLENRGHVKHKLVPLDIDGDTPLTKGDAVTTSEGVVVGDVRSSVIGPSSGKPVAIAMIKWAEAKPGTELCVGNRIARVRA